MSANKVRQCWCSPLQILSKLRTVTIQSRGYQFKTGTYGNVPRKLRVSFQEGNCEVTSSNELERLLGAYRRHGHKKANVNPIALSECDVPELDVRRFVCDVDKIISSTKFLGSKGFQGTVLEAERHLKDVYANTTGVEFMHLEEENERIWFQTRWEELVLEDISTSLQKEIAKELIKSQVLDKFLAIKFVSLKRYGAEGAETQMTFFQEYFRIAADTGANEIVIAAHHRGRLNLMIGLLNMPPELLFRKLSGKTEFPDDCKTVGDVISHLCPSSTLQIGDRKLNIQMTNLPSHLEAVCPVSLGQCRGLQQVLGDGDYSTQEFNADKVLNVQIHGDAAFMGQGVSHESLLMSCLPHFSVGGSVHVIINNQLGFTTPAHYGRGTRYASDLAKVISVPVVHVNGEHPEDVIRATRIACEYQRKFRKNAFIDLNCYRRRGHNELDDPTFTNPLIYNIIAGKSSIPDLYVSQLINRGIMTENEAEDIKNDYHAQLTMALENASNFTPPDPQRKLWQGYKAAPAAITSWDTGVDKDLLKIIGVKSVRIPDDFNVHPNIMKNHITARTQKIESDRAIDWATAEALALGSLIYNGFNVRISGQDVGRGTFSHRHAMMVEQSSDDVYIPLNHISEEQIGHLEVANSLLSEEAVLGFEYGFSNVSPNTLVIWEAQFGDFFNGAQIQIDTYVSSGEAKWMTMSGLTMLLPHGYDGAGPEHSSCRLERFLQLSDSSEVLPDGEDVNIHIVNPTTPAQYFHLLRRQMIRNYRKPLIVVAPKTLLRSPDAASYLDDMKPGTSFQPVLSDEASSDPSKVSKIIFTSGKHYYALQNYRTQNKITNAAIIRLEELSPFPTQQLREHIAKFKNAKEFIWSQEEPRNMGAWSFCSPRFNNLVGCKLKYAGRDQAPSPAVGIGEIHKKEAQLVIELPFKL